MSNFSIICNILCGVLWGINTGMAINKKGPEKWVHATLMIGFTGLAIARILGK